MSKCLYFVPTQLGCQVNCSNCKHWNGTRCKDEHLLTKPYEESDTFEFYDRLMRDNKGIRGPL